MVTIMPLALRTILILCIALPLAISPWGFDDAYYLKETLLLMAGGILLVLEASALWRGRSRRAGLPTFVLLLLILAILSFPRASNGWLFAYRLGLLLSGLAIFRTIGIAQDPPVRLMRYLKALCIAAVVATAYGVLQQLGLDPFLAPDPRFVSTFGNPHLYAEFVAPLLPTMLCLVLGSRRAITLTAALVGFGAVSAGLLWSSGRGPALAGIIALLFLLWGLLRSVPELPRTARMRLCLCGAVLVGLVTLMILTRGMVVRKPWNQPSSMLGRPRIEAAVAPAKAISMGDLGVDFRLAVYRDTLAMIQERPLTGFGLGNFRVAYRRFAKSLGMIFPERNDEVVSVGHVHNDFLEVAAELGLPAAIVLVWMFLTLARASLVAARGGTLEEGWPSLAAGSGLVGLAVNSLLAFGLYDPATSLEFWVFAGIIVASGPQVLSSGSATVNPEITRSWWRPWMAALLACVGLGMACLGISSELSDVLLNRGLARYFEGSYVDALGPLKKAARLEVAGSQARAMVAQTQMRLGAFDRAFVEVIRAQGLEPHDAQLYYLRGIALSHLGRFRESEQAQQEALALYPLYSLPHVALGELAERQGDIARASAEYESALQINPLRAEARDGLAILAVNRGDIDGAIRLWEEGARLDSNDATTAHNLAIAYERKGDAGRAAAWQAKARALGARASP